VTANFKMPSGKSKSVFLSYNQTSQKYEGKITIDNFDEIGVWKLGYVRMYDKESNNNTIYDSTLFSSYNYDKRDFSSCKFEVLGTTPDLIGPIFKDLAYEVVQITKTEAIVRYTAEVTDSLSGVYNVYANFSKPSGRSFNIYFNRQLDKFIGTVKIDKFDELGTWKLNYFTLSDYKDNYRSIREVPAGINDGFYELSKYTFTVRGVITIEPVTPSSLDLSPKESTIEPGGSVQLQTKLKLTDGTFSDATSASTGTTYTSTNPESVKVDINGHIIVSPDAHPGVVQIQAQNGKVEDSVNIIIPGDIEESFLTIKPFALTLAPGQSKQLYVEATIKNGVTEEVTSGTSGVTYQSNNNSVSVNENGMVTVTPNAIPGTAIVTVDYKGMIGEVNVVVTGPPSVDRLAMTPAVSSVPAGETIQLSVRAMMSDGSTKDVTQIQVGTTYTSSDQSRAVVSANGVVTVPPTAMNGEVIITAKSAGKIVKSTVIVSSPILKEIEVIPTSQTLHKEDSLSLSVKGLYSDGEIKDLKSESTGTTYISSVPSRAMVDSNGNITIPSTATYGDVTITIKNGQIKKAITLTVKEDISKILTQLKAKTENFIVQREESFQLEITGLYGDGAEKDLSTSEEGTSYISSVPSRALVDANGLITIPSSATYGNATITIKNGVLSIKVLVTVEETKKNELVELKANANSNTVNPGDIHQLKIVGVYTDGTQKDITNSSEGTTFISSVPSRALVDENGKITIPSTASYGPVTITIKNGDVRTTYVVTVEEDLSNVLRDLQASAESHTGFRGSEIQLQVMGTLGSGVKKDVTASSEGTTYISSVPSRALVDENGKIMIPFTATYGPVTITIINGDLRTTFVVTVEEELSNVLKDLQASAHSQTGFRGNEIQLKVMGTLGSGDKKDVTASSEGTTYISSVPSRAIADENGKITIPTTATYGPVTITIKNGDIRTTFLLTVEEDLSNTLKEINMSTASQTAFQGSELQLQVFGVFGNGEERDITASTSGTVYTSSVPSRAVVDTEGKIIIPVSASYGNVTITAKNGVIKMTYIITVTQDLGKLIKVINVDAGVTGVNRGSTKQLKVTGIYGNGDVKDITNASEGTTYISSVPSRAIVDTNGLITIPTTATFGNVTITIKNGSIRTTIILTVQ
jgi:hypothetical protein